jgi:hypothetical protein
VSTIPQSASAPQSPSEAAAQYLSRGVLDIAVARRALILLTAIRLFPDDKPEHLQERTRRLRGNPRKATEVIATARGMLKTW